MIFSGDFVQMPPVFGSPLYSGTVDNSADVTYDCARSRSCYWKGTLASSDYSCDTEEEYETKD